MKQKLLYEAPEAQTFVVQAEGVICQSGEPDTQVSLEELALDLQYGDIIII